MQRLPRLLVTDIKDDSLRLIQFEPDRTLTGFVLVCDNGLRVCFIELMLQFTLRQRTGRRVGPFQPQRPARQGNYPYCLPTLNVCDSLLMDFVPVGGLAGPNEPVVTWPDLGSI